MRILISTTDLTLEQALKLFLANTDLNLVTPLTRAVARNLCEMDMFKLILKLNRLERIIKNILNLDTIFESDFERLNGYIMSLQASTDIILYIVKNFYSAEHQDKASTFLLHYKMYDMTVKGVSNYEIQ